MKLLKYITFLTVLALLGLLGWQRYLERQIEDKIDGGFAALRSSLVAGLDPARSDDSFRSERISKKIMARLHELEDHFESTPPGTGHMAELLTQGFRGSSLTCGSSQLLRDDPGFQVTRSRLEDCERLDAASFLKSFREYLSRYSSIHRSHFQIVDLELPDAQTLRVRTVVNYELLGRTSQGTLLQTNGRWNVAWQASTEAGPWKMLTLDLEASSSSEVPQPLFSDRSSSVLGGIPSYRSQVSVSMDRWRETLDGALGFDPSYIQGVSVGDADGDGWDDLFIAQPSGLPNRLYRNRGDGTFEDITDVSQLGILDDTSMGLFADVDNDGDQDLVVSLMVHGIVLFRNHGGGSFRLENSAFQAPTEPSGSFLGLSAVDYDRDGLLDIYLNSYSAGHRPRDYRPLPYMDARNGGANTLYRNVGGGVFENVTVQAGLNQNNRRWSFVASWEDYDDDGWPDVYVANDWGLNNLYKNQGDGTFRDASSELGVTDRGAGMGIAWLDHDRDGLMDLHVSNMWSSAGHRVAPQPSFAPGASREFKKDLAKFRRGNSLYRNLGGGQFEDITDQSAISRGHWSWDSTAFDCDNDGYEDLLVTNGFITGHRLDDL